MAVGVVAIASLLLTHHPHSPPQNLFESSIKPFGVCHLRLRRRRRHLPLHSTLSTVADAADVTSYEYRNSTDIERRRQSNGEPGNGFVTDLVSFLDIASNQVKGEDSANAENEAASSREISGEIDDEKSHTQDGRHDNIVEDIMQHFNGNIVATYHGSDGKAPGGGRGGTDTNDDGDILKNPINRRANVQLPPGWGKTQLALKVISSSHANGLGMPLRSVIYVTPRLVLVDQLFDHIDRFDALKGIPHSRLIVASKSNTTETLTTDPQEIATFVSTDGDLRLLVCTYSSLPKVGKALSILGDGGEEKPSIDLAMFDEAHTMEGGGKMTGFGLNDELLPCRYRLFMTATPHTYTESPEERVVLGNRLRQDGSVTLVSKEQTNKDRTTAVRSFDNKSLFGPCVAKRTFRESVRQNITVPLQLVVFDRAELIVTLGDYIKDVPRDELLPFVLHAAFHTLNVTHAISFHSLVNRAKSFVDGVQHVFDSDMTAVAVDGRMSASKLQEMLNKAKDASSSVVSNCKLLAEGLDESEWELVFMADPVRSPSQAQQMIGRVSRVAPGKDKGYVLIPVLFDNSQTDDIGDTYSDGSEAYSRLVAALEAMVAGDPQLRRDTIFVSEESKKVGRPLKSSEYPQSLREAFLLPSTMPLDLRNNLMECVVVEVGELSSWDRNFELLLVYKGREGHCNVPRSHVENGFNLGVWLNDQRQFKKQGTLDPVRRQRLEEAGIVWDVLQDQWQNKYSILLRYKHREGQCNVPLRHVEGVVKLGEWLGTQRKLRRKGRLDPAKEQLLEEAGVVWDPIEEKWNDNLELLLQYREREGHCNVPKRHVEDGVNLGEWVGNQRKAKQDGKLDRKRELLLDEAGITWSFKKK